MKIHISTSDIPKSLQPKEERLPKQHLEAEQQKEQGLGIDKIDIARENIQAAGVKIADLQEAEKLMAIIKEQILAQEKATLAHSNITLDRAFQLVNR
jgi:hypothetical protein